MRSDFGYCHLSVRHSLEQWRGVSVSGRRPGESHQSTGGDSGPVYDLTYWGNVFSPVPLLHQPWTVSTYRMSSQRPDEKRRRSLGTGSPKLRIVPYTCPTFVDTRSTPRMRPCRCVLPSPSEKSFIFHSSRPLLLSREGSRWCLRLLIYLAFCLWCVGWGEASKVFAWRALECVRENQWRRDIPPH